MNKLLLAFLLFFTGQAAIWFQTNGQFVWPWFKKNPFTISVLFGTAISYILIYASRYVVEGFNGVLWPGRLIGFSTGMVIMTILTYIHLGEGITVKTGVTLILAFIIVMVQLYWK